MTRLELAKEIYRLEEKLGWQHQCTINEYAKKCVNGVGYVAPMRKSELEARVQDLQKRVA